MRHLIQSIWKAKTAKKNPQKKNEFILPFKSDEIAQLDAAFKKLIALEKFDAILISHLVIEHEHKAVYRIKISLDALFKFKQALDETVRYRSCELFEYKEW